ncbi:MAG: SUMF1/EgtB/PvdO family nonheme iron enzyme [Chloroflexi bacterium]|nr:SUMF1/EgtB/PvdO family nonheme iron enzyme [Chloroflexota bacterium]
MIEFSIAALAEQVVQEVAAKIWGRPELTRLREPIESAFKGDQFRKLTREAFETFAKGSQSALPQFFDPGFIQMPAVQSQLANHIVRGEAADADGLAEQYTKRFLQPSDAPNVKRLLDTYLKALRETFASDPTYGPLLLARDAQAMVAALNNLRGEMHERFDEVMTLLNKLLSEPDFKAVVERRTGTHIFLSYSSKNSVQAIKVRNALQDAHHAVWQDVTSLVGGDQWQKSIVDGIKRAYAVVLVMSQQSNESYWVTEEFLLARGLGKRIIPIRIDDCELFGKQQLHIVKAFPDFEAGLHDLVRALPTPQEGAVQAYQDAEKRQDRHQLEADYLTELLSKHRIWQTVYTPMAGVGQMRIETAEDADIEMVIAPTGIAAEFALMIDERLKPEARQQPVEKKDYADILDAVKDMRQLVVLGDPGAGKTTTLWRIAADCAERAKADTTQAIPIFIRMGAIGKDQTVEEFVRQQLGALGDYFDALLKENRLILLFDGLNELPEANRDQHLEQVKNRVTWCQQHNSIAVITCRELDYVGALDMGIPKRITITPLDPLRIQKFIKAYIQKPPHKADELFWQLAGTEAHGEWDSFVEDVGDDPITFWIATEPPKKAQGGWNEERGYFWQRWLKRREHPRSLLTLVKNPFLLFMMIQVFTQTKRIPQNRGTLFNTFIEYLLTKREKLDNAAAESLKICLSDLAYEMQRQGEGTSFSHEQVMVYLKDTQRLYQARSASILSEGDSIRFTHQLLQEFFAAQRLDRELRDGTPASTFWPSDDWWSPQRWEETAILLAGLYSNDTTPVIEWLRDVQPELTARCVLESGAHTPQQTVEALRPRWLPRLTDLHSDPMPEARAAVGRGLGMLHLDNRPGVGTVTIGEAKIPDMIWCEIPTGSYTIGGEPNANKPLSQQTINVHQPFALSKYPITLAQFQTFLDAADGFTNDLWWQGLTQEYRKQPMAEQRFKYDNAPRDSVSWYQAVAFCRWLTTKLGYEIRLPTEQEWEVAARYPDARAFPWGKEYINGYANIDETDDKGGTHFLRQVSAVGIYPQGINPNNNLADLSGNLFQWCINDSNLPTNIDFGNQSRKATRGSFWGTNSRDYARLASRSFGSGAAVGFRICCPNYVSGR